MKIVENIGAFKLCVRKDFLKKISEIKSLSWNFWASLGFEKNQFYRLLTVCFYGMLSPEK